MIKATCPACGSVLVAWRTEERPVGNGSTLLVTRGECSGFACWRPVGPWTATADPSAGEDDRQRFALELWRAMTEDRVVGMTVDNGGPDELAERRRRKHGNPVRR